jgi:hypothetical protein
LHPLTLQANLGPSLAQWTLSMVTERMATMFKTRKIINNKLNVKTNILDEG